MTDRELLELAAKAAGYKGKGEVQGPLSTPNSTRKVLLSRKPVRCSGDLLV